MGIPRSKIQEALRQTGGDVDAAMEMLMSQTGQVDDDPSFTDRAGGIMRQFGAGVGEVLPNAALGAGRMVNKIPVVGGILARDEDIERTEALLDQRRQETAPTRGGEGFARFAGRVAGEVGAAVAGGGVIKNALGIGGRAAGLLGDLGISAGVSAAGAEESSLGALGEFGGVEAASQLAENPLARVAFEATMVFGLDSVLRRMAKGKETVPPANEELPQVLGATKRRLEEVNNLLKEADDPSVMSTLRQERKNLATQRDKLESRMRTREEMSKDWESSIVDEPHINKGIRRYLSDFWTRHVDDRNPLAKMEILPGTNPLKNPEVMARALDGSENHATTSIYHGVFKPGETVDGAIQFRSRGLAEIAEDSGDAQGLSWYLAAIREDTDLIPRGKGGRLTKDQIKSAKQLAEDNPRIKQAAKDFWENRKQWLKLLEEEGVIREGAASDIIRAGNHHYAPFNAVRVAGQTTSMRKVDLNDPIYQIVKGDDPIMDPMIAAAQQDFLYTRLIRRKRMLNAMADLADEGHPSIKKLEGKPKRVQANEAGQHELPSILGEEVDQSLLGESFISRQGDKGYFQMDGTWYEASDDIINAMREAPVDDIGRVQTAMRYSGQGLRKGVILRPVFQTYNFLRDALFRSVGSKEVTKIPVAAQVQSLGQGLVAAAELADHLIIGGLRGASKSTGVDVFDQLARRRTSVPSVRGSENLIKAFEASQGGFATVSGETRDQFFRSLDQFKNPNPTRMTNMRRVGRVLSRAVEATTDVLENANRFAEFKSSRRRLLDEGLDEISANEMGAFNAAEITTNFRRSGSFYRHGIGKTIRTAATFWNPFVQGTARTGRLFKDKETAARTVSSGMGLFSAAMGLYAINRENEDYWNIPEFERKLYVHINVSHLADALRRDAPEALLPEDGVLSESGKSMFLKIPVPHELGVAFVTTPLDFISQFDDKNPFRDKGLPAFGDSAKETLMQFGGQLLPEPTVIEVSRGLMTNSHPFFGTPIENIYDRAGNVPVEQRGADDASGIARVASKGLSKLPESIMGATLPRSPAQIDYAISGLAGPLGTDFARSTDKVFQGPEGERVNRPASQMAFIRGFFSNSESLGRVAGEFYDEFNQLDDKHKLAAKEVNALRPNLQRLQDTALHPDETLRYEAYKFIDDAVSELREMVEITATDPSIDGKEKQRRINVFREEMRRWMKLPTFDPDNLDDATLSHEQRALVPIFKKTDRMVKVLESLR